MQEKTILITGASSGIGEACAMALARQGSKLILVARREGRLKAIEESLKETGAQIHTRALDVRDHDAIEAFMNSLPADFANIDILINNAGCALGIETLADAPRKDWDDMIDINVKGLLYMTRAILPGMLAREHGHIVNIGSTAAHNVYPGGSVYCATKHAVNAITKTLQLEVAGKGVRVTEIDPGAVETEFSVVRFKGDEAKAKKVYEGMKTPLSAGDVADAIVYAVTRPAHVNIAQILLYSTHQTERLPS
ncbi:MAG: SDR family NAD(P)-dependent oxidoreductase [Gammaproteobacteria bacterium]